MLILFKDKFIEDADKILRQALRQQKIALVGDLPPSYKEALISIGKLYEDLKKQEEF